MDPLENEHMGWMDMMNAMNGCDDEHGVTPAPDAPFIEYWMWHGGELLPATPAELEWIHMREREREARWHLKQWRHSQRAQSRGARWQSLHAIYAAVAGRLAIWGRDATRHTSRRAPTEAAKETKGIAQKWITPTER